MIIIEILNIEPKTHKLKTIKEALLLGYNIPKTYLVIPQFKNSLDFINSLEDTNWLIRISTKESTSGLIGATIKKEEISNEVINAIKRYGSDIEVILQQYIQSDIAGIMLSSYDVYIESVCGSGYGLARAGIKPSTYSIKRNNILANVVKQSKKYHMVNAQLVEVECNEYSEIKSNLMYKLLEMSRDFKGRIVNWCCMNDNLYFLEYWPFKKFSNKIHQGKITHIYNHENYDILVIPNAHIKFQSECLNSRGVISRVGGYLSHLAVNCIEKNIPFIISDEEYIDGELVFLDQEKRIVKRLIDLI